MPVYMQGFTFFRMDTMNMSGHAWVHDSMLLKWLTLVQIGRVYSGMLLLR